MPMKRLLLSIFILFLNLTLLLGQDRNKASYSFAKEVFRSKKYKRNAYPRFQKPIQRVDSNVYRFGDKIIRVHLEDEQLVKLFGDGIFNPDLIFGETTSRKPKPTLGIAPQSQNEIFNLTRNDSLSICCIKELTNLNHNPRTKRFLFWLFRIGLANPTEYYIEFYNKKATRATSMKDFVENANITFYYQGTIII